MHLPLTDWQFYVVTAAFLVAGFVFLRTMLPKRRAAARRKRVNLTIGGKRS